jgi:hypothetical protein
MRVSGVLEQQLRLALRNLREEKKRATPLFPIWETY